VGTDPDFDGVVTTFSEITTLVEAGHEASRRD
jgi:hypothetical protein